MNLEGLLVEIRTMGYRWGLNFDQDNDEVTIAAHKPPKTGHPKESDKIIKTGPITAMPNLAFLVLREIRAIKKADKNK